MDRGICKSLRGVCLGRLERNMEGLTRLMYVVDRIIMRGKSNGIGREGRSSICRCHHCSNRSNDR